MPAPAVGLISHAQQTLCTTNVLYSLVALLRAGERERRINIIRNALHVFFRVFVPSEEETKPAGGLLCATTNQSFLF